MSVAPLPLGTFSRGEHSSSRSSQRLLRSARHANRSSRLHRRLRQPSMTYPRFQISRATSTQSHTSHHSLRLFQILLHRRQNLHDPQSQMPAYIVHASPGHNNDQWTLLSQVSNCYTCQTYDFSKMSKKCLSGTKYSGSRCLTVLLSTHLAKARSTDRSNCSRLRWEPSVNLIARAAGRNRTAR